MGLQSDQTHRVSPSAVNWLTDIAWKGHHTLALLRKCVEFKFRVRMINQDEWPLTCATRRTPLAAIIQRRWNVLSLETSATMVAVNGARTPRVILSNGHGLRIGDGQVNIRQEKKCTSRLSHRLDTAAQAATTGIGNCDRRHGASCFALTAQFTHWSPVINRSKSLDQLTKCAFFLTGSCSCSVTEHWWVVLLPPWECRQGKVPVSVSVFPHPKWRHLYFYHQLDSATSISVPQPCLVVGKTRIDNDFYCLIQFTLSQAAVAFLILNLKCTFLKSLPHWAVNGKKLKERFQVGSV